MRRPETQIAAGSFELTAAPRPLNYARLRRGVKSGTGILLVGFCGIGVLPMLHGLEAHATTNQLFTHLRRNLEV